MSTYQDNLARTLPQQQPAPQYQPQKQHQPARSPQQKQEAREKVKWLFTVVFCLSIAISLAGRYAHMVSLNYQLESERHNLQTMKDQQLKLEQQVLQMEAPERIKSVATNQLGMKQVDEHKMVIVQGSKN
ncbi:cell division protein FtsL [Tumebacillus permanentifrigoris]|uniref:Cell division protein FtsL n=1 Tax=Tumebacillus permanentifrigoris TaxID=378543 RepID=A0A316D959_9BACL|nr:cell division protein FtsL [Tumebacillus permanentifrigoris]PWK11625.1 cell division protein FtsL [Tumebacillus permanentifrigoris]